jgi:hypothetical protein
MSRQVCAHAFVFAMGTAAMAGCGDAGSQSELDTAGPPRVTVVTVSTANGEAPAYCVGPEADKISVVCLDAAGNYIFDDSQPVEAVPTGWEVRLVFNELLDADRAEELVELPNPDNPDEPLRDQYGNPVIRGTLESSQPVLLTCNGAPVAYDGYYNPSGNHLSLPPGPSLVVQALDQVPTSATCRVEVKQGESNPGFGVFDKAGNPISADERGPFEFRTAALAITDVSPATDVEGVNVDIAPLVSFNAPIDPASLGADAQARVRLRTAADDVDVAATLAVENENSVRLTPAAALTPATEYELVVYGGITDAAGGPPLMLEAEPAVQSTFTTTGMAPPTP